jgi:hypothetical protein
MIEEFLVKFFKIIFHVYIAKSLEYLWTVFYERNGAVSEKEAVLGFRISIFLSSFYLMARVFERFNETEQSFF